MDDNGMGAVNPDNAQPVADRRHSPGTASDPLPIV